MKIFQLATVVVTMMLMYSCQQPEGNSTGSEYMPDMAHSAAYEANIYNYYYFNTWGTEAEYYGYAQPRLPVKGTVPRSLGNVVSTAGIAGNQTYMYGNTEEERARAMEEMINNPLPITTGGLAHGKELYNIYCGICHGEKGDGGGYLVRDDGGVYPAQPANFLLDEHVTASNGRYYHAIMHGRNLMGAYKDKLNYEERWNVIHYIRSLQAKEMKKEYNEVVNTFNTTATPAATLVNKVMKNHVDELHSDESHDVDHGNNGHH